MDEKIPDKIKEAIHNQVGNVFELIIDRAAKDGTLESLIKTLIVEKIMNYLGPLIDKPGVNKVAKVGVRKAVDISWENNKEKLHEKIESLKTESNIGKVVEKIPEDISEQVKETLTEKIKDKIAEQVEKTFEFIIQKAAKGKESLDELIKTLIVEKIMNVLAALIKRPIVKKLSKKAVKKAVDKAWENNKTKLEDKINSLKQA